jgi:acyl-CoA thioester hydrolase
MVVAVKVPGGHLPLSDDGWITSYSGVVRRWECGRNDRWDIQFYARAFQAASEVLAVALTGRNPGSAGASLRHYRFHHEVFCPAPVTIRSARISGGPLDGALAHRMETGAERQLAATAIEWPAIPVADLPACDGESVTAVMMRGLSPAPHLAARQSVTMPQGRTQVVPVGVVRPVDVDHLGNLAVNELVNRCSQASHLLYEQFGFTRSWVESTNCSPVAVEMKVTSHDACTPGTVLDVNTSVAASGGKTFSTLYRVFNAISGAPLATVEQLMIIVDLEKRRAVPLPDFIAVHAADAAGSGL